MTKSIIKYSLDQQTGKSKFIDDVSNGISCNCICAKCGKKMVAVQGEKRKKEWHFRHYEETDCAGGQETAIHKLAKQIIVDNIQISLPGEKLLYTLGKQEEAFLTIVPDVTVFANGQNVYFEIAVTHAIEALKENFYKSGQHKSIEIDLKGVPYDITPIELEEIVLHKTQNKRKIFWTAETTNVSGKDNNSFWQFLIGVALFIIMLKFFRRKNKK